MFPLYLPYSPLGTKLVLLVKVGAVFPLLSVAASLIPLRAVTGCPSRIYQLAGAKRP